tara:strand:+ start:266 stop:580 length:315 start_codon:yes stop_codon:yes gene_type:complete
MNPQPEQVLKELKDWQIKMKACKEQIDARKVILEDYYSNSFIMSRFEIDGIKAERRRKPEKWKYSDKLNSYRKDILDALEDREQQEREEGIATKIDTGFTWAIR